MPRRARQCPGGIVYHVLNRAVARIDLFKSAKDHLAFQQTLREAHARLPVDVLSYCVMLNHWHLVLRPLKDGDLSAFMQWLTLAHAQRWRTAHHSIGYGPLYQGRFKAFPIQEDAHLLTVLRYVERNPLRARIVRRAQDWRWSSLHARLNDTGQERVTLADWPIDRPSNWVQFVNKPQTPAEERSLELSIHRSRPFGDTAWQVRTAKRLGLLSCFRAPGRPKGTGTGKTA
jgi:putative transposase